MSLQEILAMVLSLLVSMGLMPYIQGALVIMLVGGFLAVVFRNR